MRKLNKKQIKLIEEHVKNHGIDNMAELKRKCEDINDYETIYQDVQRYAEDLYMKI